MATQHQLKDDTRPSSRDGLISTPNLRHLKDAGLASGAALTYLDSSLLYHTMLRHSLRKGKWTSEEELYVDTLIEEFQKGHLLLSETFSLRIFLANMVLCSPKRISKKFERTNYNGKQLYKQNQSKLSPEEASQRSEILEKIEGNFQESLKVLAAEMTKKATRKMAMRASVPVVVAPSTVDDTRASVPVVVAPTTVDDTRATPSRKPVASPREMERVSPTTAQLAQSALTNTSSYLRNSMALNFIDDVTRNGVISYQHQLKQRLGVNEPLLRLNAASIVQAITAANNRMEGPPPLPTPQSLQYLTNNQNSLTQVGGFSAPFGNTLGIPSAFSRASSFAGGRGQTQGDLWRDPSTALLQQTQEELWWREPSTALSFIQRLRANRNHGINAVGGLPGGSHPRVSPSRAQDLFDLLGRNTGHGKTSEPEPKRRRCM